VTAMKWNSSVTFLIITSNRHAFACAGTETCVHKTAMCHVHSRGREKGGRGGNRFMMVARFTFQIIERNKSAISRLFEKGK